MEHRQQLKLGTACRKTVSTRWGCALALAAIVAAPAFGQEPGSAERVGERIDERVHTIDHSVEVYVSNEALQVQYIRELDISGVGPVEARAGVFYNEQRDLIGTGDVLVNLGDRANRRQIEVSVGTRMYAAFLNTENEDTFSMGLGGEAQYFFSRQRRTSLDLTYFYAPDILSFGIANRINDAALRLQTRIGEGTDIFVGYRSLELSTTVGKRDVDDKVHIGFRHSF